MSVLIVGITGGIACGKTNLTDALLGAGVRVVDADEVSRALTAPGGKGLPALREAFGDGVFDGEALNRRALGEMVFADPEKKTRLNACLHPLILAECRRLIDGTGEGVVFLSAPLLYECGMDAWCDRVWCAYVPQKEQLRRLMARDRLTRGAALRRIRSQMPALEKARRSQAVIRTDGSPAQSAEKVLALYRALTAERAAARPIP